MIGSHRTFSSSVCGARTPARLRGEIVRANLGGLELTQAPQAAGYVGLRGARRAAEHARDLRDRQVGHVPQHHGDALAVRQQAQQRGQLAGRLVPLRLRLGAGTAGL